jgi:hypothetical protein
MNRCPSLEQLQRLLADQLSGSEAETLERHVESCAACQQALEQLTTAGAASPTRPWELGAAGAPEPQPARGDGPDVAFVRQLEQAVPAGLGAPRHAAASLPPTLHAAPEPVAVPSELPVVPGYEVLGIVGRGGMGVVYRARQIPLNRVVALKMLLTGGHARPEEMARFRVEAEAVARLQHPHIVAIHEVGQHDGWPFLVMEFVEGDTLAHQLGGTPLPARRSAELAETLARAIHHAHQHGIIHRDLTPANILLRRKSEIRNPKSER